MKINQLDIHGIGGIQHISLTFDPKMNFICGPNGIGKTTIAECLIQSFTLSTDQIKRNVQMAAGSITTTIQLSDGTTQRAHVPINTFSPIRDNHANSNTYANIELTNRLIQVRINRTFDHQALSGISPDQTRNNAAEISKSNKKGIQGHSIKGWLANRWLFAAQANGLTEIQRNNLDLSKKCFSILDNRFSFAKIDSKTFELSVNTPSGEIPFEYLSSGFKSTLTLLLGIIAEIESRFHDLSAADFDGVIIIDEIELHLHPEWQAKIIFALQQTFTKAQFIITTHSPHVIQTAQPNQVIALEFHGESVVQRDLSESRYGFQGWTVEEILLDVMGMSTTQSVLYKNTISRFDKAIDTENITDAQSSYSELVEMLHPNSHLRKLFAFQLIGIGGVVND